MSLKNRLLTLAGLLLLGIGAVGVMIPVLPATPFVITASVCFSGNPRIRAWLMKSRFFAEHVTNYKQRTGLRKHTVATSLGFLWITLFLSMLAVRQVWIVLLLTGVGISVTVYILWIARPKGKSLIVLRKENTNISEK